jgi:hypothetical protein
MKDDATGTRTEEKQIVVLDEGKTQETVLLGVCCISTLFIIRAL